MNIDEEIKFLATRLNELRAKASDLTPEEETEMNEIQRKIEELESNKNS